MNRELIRDDLRLATGEMQPPAGQTLRDALARLDAWAQKDDLPGDFAHYLSRRSYVKALEWLEHPDMHHRV